MGSLKENPLAVKLLENWLYIIIIIIFDQFQGRRESSGTLNTQYLRQALAEVANMQEFPCEDVRSISDVTIQSFDEDDDVTVSSTQRPSLNQIPE